MRAKTRDGRGDEAVYVQATPTIKSHVDVVYMYDEKHQNGANTLFGILPTERCRWKI